MNLIKYSMFAILLTSSIYTTPNALEVTAANKGLQNAVTGFDARLNTSTAALQAAINQILTCNNKGMTFVSDEAYAGRDVDGCVAPPLPEDVSLELEDVTIATDITRSETNDFVHNIAIPSSIKPWGGLTLQMNVINGKYPTAPGYAVTYTLDDINTNQAKETIHSASSDGCESPGSASYKLYAQYTASSRTITLTYDRSGTKNTTACKTIGFNIHTYSFKKAVLK